MESPIALKTYKFEDMFVVFLKTSLVRRDTPNSQLKLQKVKFVTFMAVIHTILVLTMVISVIEMLISNSKLSIICGSGAIGSVFLIGIFRTVSLLTNQDVLKRLLGNLEELFPVSTEEQLEYDFLSFIAPTISLYKVLSKLFSFVLLAFLTLPILYSVYFWMVRDQVYRFIYPYIAWVPFDDDQVLGYVFIYWFQVVCSFGGALLFFNEDLIFSTSVTQLCMHYRFLGKRLSQMDYKNESKSHLELRTLIGYQNSLTRLTKDVDKIFSMSTFFGFTIVKISLCMFIISLVNEIELINIAPYCLSVCALIVPVYMRCALGSNLNDASEELINSIYDSNWYEGSPRYRKILTIMMIRANRPIQLQASPMNSIGIEYFKEVIVQAYEFFMFLRNFTTKP